MRAHDAPISPEAASHATTTTLRQYPSATSPGQLSTPALGWHASGTCYVAVRGCAIAKAELALIVASYRRPDAIRVLMQALARQTLPHSAFEVAFVGDGRDETEAAYQEAFGWARGELALPIVHCAFQENAGPARARHHGILATSAPWICITDDDMEPDPGYLAAHLGALQDGGDDRTVVIGKVVPETGWERQPVYEAMRTQAMLEMHQALASGARRGQGTLLVTQNVSLSRPAYFRVGGFDESLRLGEDTELGWRLERDGARFVFAPGAAAVHRSRVGSYETWLARQFQYGRNAVYIHRKLGGDPLAHPLRNLVNGSALNRAAVFGLCWSRPLGRWAIRALRAAGLGFQRWGFTAAAVASHKAILALAFHSGVKDALGSWSALLATRRAFAATPGRPLDPT